MGRGDPAGNALTTLLGIGTSRCCVAAYSSFGMAIGARGNVGTVENANLPLG